MFRVQRDENGVFDYGTVESLANIPNVSYLATYGTAYIPELNALLLLGRADGLAVDMPVRLYEIGSEELHTIGTLKTTEAYPNGANLGFRTRFSEWYPLNGLVRVGYDMRENRHNNAVNKNGVFGNKGYGFTDYGKSNINNLAVQVFFDGEKYGMALSTYYI